MRRSILLAILVGGLLGLPVAALADDAVEEIMAEAAEASFEGTGVVVCTWGADSAAATYEVARSDGMAVEKGPGGSTMSHGNVSAMRSDSDWAGTGVEEWAEWAVGARYTLGEASDTTRLGRPAVALTILEDGRPRVRLVIDAASRVPLSTEVLDGEGRVYRMAALVTFEPGPVDMPEEMPGTGAMGWVRAAPGAGALPSEADGYLRADTYAVGPDTLQAFYTDGLFSFSVFEAPRGQRPGMFQAATEFTSDGHRYRRIVTPTAVWVHWDAPDRTYVLVGDLPPDHLMAVLDGLPRPGERGLLVRLWRMLFG